jgi:hypothetical protein
MSSEVNRCFLCQALTGNGSGTAAGTGHQFFCSYRCIAGFIRKHKKKKILFGKLKNIKFK